MNWSVPIFLEKLIDIKQGQQYKINFKLIKLYLSN